MHLGDLGNPLTNEQLDRLRGKVDILLALTGGPPTIELEDLDRAIEEIAPRIVIPMHYQIPRLKLDILPLEAFTSRYPQGAITRVGSAEVGLSQSTLPRTLSIYVLDPAGERMTPVTSGGVGPWRLLLGQELEVSSTARRAERGVAR